MDFGGCSLVFPLYWVSCLRYHFFGTIFPDLTLFILWQSDIDLALFILGRVIYLIEPHIFSTSVFLFFVKGDSAPKCIQ